LTTVLWACTLRPGRWRDAGHTAPYPSPRSVGPYESPARRAGPPVLVGRARVRAWLRGADAR
jgi:hypothetical protein